jgi:hypothetical protein
VSTSYTILVLNIFVHFVFVLTDGLVLITCACVSNFQTFRFGICLCSGTLANGLGMPGPCNGTGEALLGTAFLFQQASLMSELAKVIDMPAQAVDFASLAAETKTAFNKVFYNEASGSYKDGCDNNWFLFYFFTFGGISGSVLNLCLRVVAILLDDTILQRRVRSQLFPY